MKQKADEAVIKKGHAKARVKKGWKEVKPETAAVVNHAVDPDAVMRTKRRRKWY